MHVPAGARKGKGNRARRSEAAELRAEEAEPRAGRGGRATFSLPADVQAQELQQLGLPAVSGPGCQPSGPAKFESGPKAPPARGAPDLLPAALPRDPSRGRRPHSTELLLCSVMKDRRKGEKVEPRRCAKTNHVRRNLFGPVDHSNLQLDIQRILCTSMEKAKQRWNFDFWQEVPTEGLLQWEELQGHDVPPFYHTCVVREAPRPLQPMNRASAKEPKARHNGKVIEKPSKMAGKKSRPGRKRRQTSLTDYYQAKKQIRTDMQTPVKKPPF
uniref:uncharacterized protein LOC114596769 n=1 Tax=Podarcis muralis TaxID=64176 RepID=UPI00109F5999|nr:uncharacterized protein LOC114596769 [Podarcis muralis]